MLEKLFKKQTVDTPEYMLEQKKSFQHWLPIEDVDRGFIKVKNVAYPEYYPVIQLGEKNIDLMTEDQQYQLAQGLEKIFASVSSFHSFQIIVLPMPFNIEVWLNYTDKRLRQLQKQQEAVHEKVLEAKRTRNGKYQDYVQHEQALGYYERHLIDQKAFVRAKLSEGSIINRQAFFIPKFDGLKDLSDYQDATDHVVSKFREVLPGTRQCNSQEIRNILFTILNPMNRQYFKTPGLQTSPIIEDPYVETSDEDEDDIVIIDDTNDLSDFEF